MWDSLLDADLNARYWSHLTRGYYNWDKWSKIFLAAMASGTVASWSFWAEVEIGIKLWQLLSAISALLAIALPILNWPKMIQSMTALQQQWMQMRADYEILWMRLKGGTDMQQVEKEWTRLKQKESRVATEEYHLPRKKKLLDQCYEEVLESRGLNNK